MHFSISAYTSSCLRHVRILIALLALLTLSSPVTAVERHYAVSEDAEQPILSLGWAGGSLESPRFTLYGDGRLIGRVSLPSGPSVGEPIEVVLSHNDVQSVMKSIVDAGLVDFRPGDQNKRIGPRLNYISDSSSLLLEVSLESYDSPGRKEVRPFIHRTGIDSPHEEIKRYRKEKLAGRVADTEPDTFVEAETLLQLYDSFNELVFGKQ